MRISDWSSDVCSSDLDLELWHPQRAHRLRTGRARSRIRGLRYQHHQGKIFHAIVIAGKHAFRTHLLHAGRSPDLWRVRDLALLNRPPPSFATGHLIEANSGPEAALASGPFSIDSRSEMQQRPGRFSVPVSARSTSFCLYRKSVV